MTWQEVKAKRESEGTSKRSAVYSALGCGKSGMQATDEAERQRDEVWLQDALMAFSLASSLHTFLISAVLSCHGLCCCLHAGPFGSARVIFSIEFTIYMGGLTTHASPICS